ncbi:MAG: hypothetical protein NXI16_09235 [Alphaproteobacteria bacterium]|nr:hypothetical protein [Alphaproteobacteria bacterium]
MRRRENGAWIDLDQAEIDAESARIAAVAAGALDREKAEAEREIDAAAEAARAAIVTPGAGQAMSYLAKEAEARRVLAGAASSALLEPLIGVEVDPVTGDVLPDLASVAAVIVAQADAWMALEGQIDAARRGAKIQIAAAADSAAITAARDAGLSALQAV